MDSFFEEFERTENLEDSIKYMKNKFMKKKLLFLNNDKSYEEIKSEFDEILRLKELLKEF
ncbi:hypothetical protein A0H76_2770 [Hepatospora eriocheir]|uniref:Uncharacterized protein n=1 Tax=Hepatospora eriocheir TaxID=1081669 RepID=A0A1X0QET7_9MICR|nr:hypothetical protein HERIO_1976 [Hepatospora eriocheir]ORD98297.1 hypothetical protein A0H76_2770 [Hepatospora eriocheir]